MLKRVLTIFYRDIKSGTRDYMIFYILIIPLVLAALLRAFIPSAGANVIKMAVMEDADQAFVQLLEEHGKVETFSSREKIINRVGAADDIFGVIASGNSVEIISAGNESEGSLELVQAVVNSWYNSDVETPISVSFSDMGWQLSPLGQYGSSFLVIFISIFGGMIILINLVEEKQYNTLSAINVTPLRRFEYVIGKGLLGFIIPVLHAYAILLILGYTRINYLMVTLVVLAIALIGVIIGFSIGIYNDEPIGAIASMKVVFIPIFGSIFGGIFLAEKWHPLLYWSPFYWAFRSMDRIVLEQAGWLEIIRNCVFILLLSALVFLFLRKRIQRGLQ